MQGPGETPPPGVVGVGQDKAAGFPPEGRRSLPVIGEVTSDWLVSYQRNQERGTSLTAPLF